MTESIERRMALTEEQYEFVMEENRELYKKLGELAIMVTELTNRVANRLLNLDADMKSLKRQFEQYQISIPDPTLEQIIVQWDNKAIDLKVMEYRCKDCDTEMIVKKIIRNSDSKPCLRFECPHHSDRGRWMKVFDFIINSKQLLKEHPEWEIKQWGQSHD